MAPPAVPPPLPAGMAQEESWHRATLEREPWFHGAISRKEGEARLTHDGDFLVRESHNSPGQFVLTGMQNGARRHLLLVDPAGVVRVLSFLVCVEGGKLACVGAKASNVRGWGLSCFCLTSHDYLRDKCSRYGSVLSIGETHNMEYEVLSSASLL